MRCSITSFSVWKLWRISTCVRSAAAEFSVIFLLSFRSVSARRCFHSSSVAVPFLALSSSAAASSMRSDSASSLSFATDTSAASRRTRRSALTFSNSPIWAWLCWVTLSSCSLVLAAPSLSSLSLPSFSSRSDWSCRLSVSSSDALAPSDSSSPLLLVSSASRSAATLSARSSLSLSCLRTSDSCWFSRAMSSEATVWALRRSFFSAASSSTCALSPSTSWLSASASARAFFPPSASSSATLSCAAARASPLDSSSACS
mmetsp:Transcript_30178/g.76459  ORF Transcript_30178/g.76459 Transcript_30178/m.76459 type:complete len:259 (+) Transcript_30178:1885-2661(+)